MPVPSIRQLALATILLATLGCTSTKASRHAQRDAVQVARLEALAERLGDETAKHIFRESHHCEIDAIKAELKNHPQPDPGDSTLQSQLLVGRWQTTRHTEIYSPDGTWRMAPESGTTHGHWRIERNRFFEDGREYKIILLNARHFIFTDGNAVFYTHRLPD